MTKKIIIGIILLLVAIQVIRIDKTNPPVDKSKDFITLTHPSEEIRAMLVTSCYDCHSHETTYPWYSNVAPASWFLKNHINDGRKHLNFSTWSDYSEKKQQHKLEECIDEVKEGEMPLTPYTWTHQHAALTPNQQEKLAAWFRTWVKEKK
ncbi:MAG TPA: heme-binding domain-containing protein [Cytophagaceae bacterium]|jgi:hypothetical protein|nr:heme-binding domain-containing protein [Cytophagaceae bacterium]